MANIDGPCNLKQPPSEKCSKNKKLKQRRISVLATPWRHVAFLFRSATHYIVNSRYFKVEVHLKLLIS